MIKKVYAIYEDGVFKPTEPVNLPENSEVEFEIEVAADAAQKPSIEDVYALLGNRYDSGQDDVAERHDEHQPWMRYFWIRLDDELDTAWLAYEYKDADRAGIVDQVSFAVMRRLGIRQAFTNDKHFEAAGFEVLF